LYRFECRNVGSVRLKQFYKSNIELDYSYVIISAVEANNIKVLEFFHDMNILDTTLAFDYALRSENSDIIKWLIEAIGVKISLLKDLDAHYDYNISAAMIKYLHGNNYELSSYFYEIIKLNQDSLNYLIQHNIRFPERPQLCYKLARLADIHIMDMYIANGLTLNIHTIDYSGSIQMFEYLEKLGQKTSNGVYVYASFPVFKYFIKNRGVNSIPFGYSLFLNDRKKIWVDKNKAKFSLFTLFTTRFV
jgi:hypothetical protein